MGPLEFFENENFDARAPKIWIWTSKIIPDLWLVDLFWPIKKNFHTPPPYCTGHHCKGNNVLPAYWFYINNLPPAVGDKMTESHGNTGTRPVDKQQVNLNIDTRKTQQNNNSCHVLHIHCTGTVGTVCIKISVAEPKLFIFGSSSNFGHNFGSGSSSSYSYILALKTFLKH